MAVAEQTRGKTTQWIKGGDFTTALKNFKNLGITNIVEIQTTYGSTWKFSSTKLS